MTWRDVAGRDLLCVYRSRTGTAVAAIVALFTVLLVGLMAIAADLAFVAAIGGAVTVAALVVMVFVGTPRTIAGFVALFTVLAVLVTAVYADQSDPPDVEMAILVVGSALSLVVPIVAMLGSYAAIVGERTTGSVRFLFGLPNSRWDAYVGKFLSRSLVVLVPLVVGLSLAAVVVHLSFRGGSLLDVAGLTVLTIPFALLFVGFGLSASAWADTDNMAVAVVVAVFAVFRVGWPSVQLLGLEFAGHPRPRPAWYFWVGRVNPLNAYVKLTTEFTSFATHHPLLSQPREGVAPLATSTTFAMLVLAIWTVVVPLFGLVFVRRRDML